LRKFAETEADKTVEMMMADTVSKMAAGNATKPGSPDSDSWHRAEIEQLVRNALITYDADKTGLFDFALETAGGAVVSTR
jgi:hypothetical protein